MMPAVGKSGPLTCFISSSTVISRVARCRRPSRRSTSRRLCGGMFVAMPTAMPGEPLTSRFGKRAGRTSGSCFVAVVVGREIDRVLVDVAQHLHREPRQLRLGVAHRGRRVVVDRAEVALTVDERVAHREVLRQAHERVVDRAVAVRVVLAHDFADDARALRLASASGAQAELAHAVEDAAMDRLEAVAHVGQRARRRSPTSRSRGYAVRISSSIARGSMLPPVSTSPAMAVTSLTSYTSRLATRRALLLDELRAAARPGRPSASRRRGRPRRRPQS